MRSKPDRPESTTQLKTGASKEAPVFLLLALDCAQAMVRGSFVGFEFYE